MAINISISDNIDNLLESSPSPVSILPISYIYILTRRIRFFIQSLVWVTTIHHHRHFSLSFLFFFSCNDKPPLPNPHLEDNVTQCQLCLFSVDHSIGSVHGPGDILTCGGCKKQFGLSDIVRFIQHKVRTCPAILTASNSSDRRDNSAVAAATAAAAALLNNNNLDAKNNHSSSSAATNLLVESPSSSTPCSEDEEDDDNDDDRPENYSKIPSSKCSNNNNNNNNNSNNANNNNIGDKHGGSDAEDEADHDKSTTAVAKIPVVKIPPSISAPINSRRSKGHPHQHQSGSHHDSNQRKEGGEDPPLLLLTNNKSDASVNTSSSSGSGSGEIVVINSLLLLMLIAGG